MKATKVSNEVRDQVFDTWLASPAGRSAAETVERMQRMKSEGPAARKSLEDARAASATAVAGAHRELAAREAEHAAALSSYRAAAAAMGRARNHLRAVDDKSRSMVAAAERKFRSLLDPTFRQAVDALASHVANHSRLERLGTPSEQYVREGERASSLLARAAVLTNADVPDFDAMLAYVDEVDRFIAEHPLWERSDGGGNRLRGVATARNAEVNDATAREDAFNIAERFMDRATARKRTVVGKGAPR